MLPPSASVDRSVCCGPRSIGGCASLLARNNSGGQALDSRHARCEGPAYKQRQPAQGEQCVRASSWEGFVLLSLDHRAHSGKSCPRFTPRRSCLASITALSALRLALPRIQGSPLAAYEKLSASLAQLWRVVRSCHLTQRACRMRYVSHHRICSTHHKQPVDAPGKRLQLWRG